MNNLTLLPAVRAGSMRLRAAPSRADAANTPTVQRLPFLVRWARGESDLAAIVDLRARCYGRHLPELRQRLGQPDALDHDRRTRLLLVEARGSGRAIGTLRIEHNRGHALAVQASVALPPAIGRAHLVEVTRLAIDAGAPPSTRPALFKALYLHALAQQVDWIIATARRPLARLYEGLLFTDMLPGAPELPMRHVAGLPHRVLGLELASAQPAWQQARHPLLAFMTATQHPDIVIDEPEAATPALAAAA